MHPDGDAHPEAAAEAPAPILYGKRAVSGAAMLTSLRVGTRLLGALQLLIFSKVCGDESTGVIGIGLLTLATLETFSQFGIRQALIQRRGDVSPHYGTAFTFQALRGALLAAGVFAAAPLIAQWFRAPDAVPVLRAFAFIPLMRGAINIAAIEFERNLDFAKAVAIDAGTPLIDFAVTILLLWLNPGVMALVWGKIAGVASAVALSYILARQPWRPGWSTPRFLELVSFGGWLLLTGVISLLVTRGADFVVGRLLSTAELGVYTLAVMLAVLPMLELNTVIARVAFPAYARIQDDPGRLRSAFLRSFLVVSTSVLGVMTVIVVASRDFVALVLGPEWDELGRIMPLLAVWGACRAMGGATSSVFYAVGKPVWVSYYHAVMLVMLAVLLVPMTSRGGLPGVAWTLAAVGLTAQTIRYGLIARLIHARAWSIYCRTLFPLASAAAAVAAAWGLGLTIPHAHHAARMAVLIPAAVAIYALGLLIWDRTSSVDVVGTLASLIPTRFRPRRLA